MSDDLYLPIGQRIRQARRRRGLSQEVFGGLIGRSKSWVIKAEQGTLPLDRISVLIRIAEVLRVQLSWLIQDINGHRVDEGRRQEAEGVRVLRDLLAELPYRTSPSQEPRSLASLEADPWAVQALRAQVRHADSIAALPGLLTGLHDAAVGLGGEEQQRAWGLLTRGFEITARTLGRYGDRQLSWMAAERAAQAAERSGAPDNLVLGAHSASLGLQGLGYLDEALRVAEHGLSRAEPDMGSPRVRAMVGCLHMYVLAISFARAGDPHRAQEALAEGEALLYGPDGRVDAPADIRDWMEWRPANLRIQQVSARVDADDPRGWTPTTRARRSASPTAAGRRSAPG